MEEIKRSISEELVESYMNYSMSVIIGRAIPDVRDGLKPVQRRILFSMNELNLKNNGPTKKSARIVGEVMGKYHPHGDMAIYDALVRMAQDFTMRYPLVHGQGNFGSIDRDPPAASRYTEAKLSKIAEEMLEDIEENTVDMVPNFDETLKEPVVLPSKIPQLLLNGASGIAVGMATSIPPHNIGEVADLISKFIDNPEMTDDEVASLLKGPDFPTGGILMDSEAIRNIYRTGRGSIVIRSRTSIEEYKNRSRIIVTEIPYGVSKASLIEQIAEYAKNSKENIISDIRDESDKEGLRIVIEIARNADANIVLNRLLKHTALETHFAVQMLVIDHGKPRLMNLKQIIKAFTDHRYEVIKRRSEYEFEKFSKRAHIVEGLIKASRAIGTVVDIVKNSRDLESAIDSLMKILEVSKEQAEAIMDMKLQRLTTLEHAKLDEEYKNLIENMGKLHTLLGSDRMIMEEIKKDMEYIKSKYGDPRRSEISQNTENINIEDLIPDDEIVVTITHNGYVSATKLESYKMQSRGGKGNISIRTREDDYVEHTFVTTKLSYTGFITNLGKFYFIKNYNFQENEKGSKGKLILNYFNLSPNEKVKSIISIGHTLDPSRDMWIATKSGKIKRISLSEFSFRANGVLAIKLEDGDEVVDSALTDTNEKNIIALSTLKGFVNAFKDEDVRKMGRMAMGIRGIKLREGDEVVSMIVLKEDEVNKVQLLTITEKGLGKRSPFSDYPIHKRGSHGVRNLRLTAKNGLVVSTAKVLENDEIIAVTANGKAIRFKVSDLSITSRNTQGFRCVDLDPEDKVVAFTLLRGIDS
ncbi:MAG: DNA gyrase subunit A [Mesoaciditoga sp.]|uniref:DNA gyrase subunit A n=1 Tax=Athalassotoga sp. TaxID=2022597 RepID=UPI000CAEDCD0|nr:MAG: DNA gyrase subunit A [Mesoaciditoga sp.]PMP80455.1 MAG: DNA gyrase subunit A [Mesoaciditoga sp.]HEU24713.1 DNA gyrase subunit A [Mesoaciditoga lauensis]